MTTLFEPLRIGALPLQHRIVMAPLTRMRSEPGDRPGALMRDYYAQRASAGGLIVSEATPVSREGYGYAGAPGIYDDAQIDGWRAVTDAVHARGGIIALQLWHVGRQSNPALQPNGADPVAPSAIAAEGDAYTATGPVPFTVPRALDRTEIPGLVAAFGQAAERARRAGFDAVEIHGANGYLPDQFLQDGSNTRDDEYGGPIANRARFLLEITGAAIAAMGADRVGVRLSPSGRYGSMHDSDPAATFGYAAERLDALGIAWLHVVEPRIVGTEERAAGEAAVAARDLRARFRRGRLIAAGGFDAAGAEAILRENHADAVAFGRAFIANPDLPERLRQGWPLNRPDRATFYGGDARGYTDYPFHDGAPATRSA